MSFEAIRKKVTMRMKNGFERRVGYEIEMFRTKLKSFSEKDRDI